VRKSSTILIALLLLIPVASWTASTGGLRACLGSSHHCSMTMAPGSICHMQAAPDLTLPACMLPVMPLPARITGVPMPLIRRFTARAVAAFATVRPRAIFHPPQA